VTVIIYSIDGLARGVTCRVQNRSLVGLLKTLGVDVPALIKSKQNLKNYEARGMHAGVFFDAETFGAGKRDRRRHGEEIAQTETATIDYMPGVSSDEKKQRRSRMSYEAFLRDVVRVDQAVLKYLREGRPQRRVAQVGEDSARVSCCTPKRYDTNATMRYAVSVCRAPLLRASCSPSTRGCCASVVHVCKTYTFRLHSLRGFNIHATKFGKIAAAFRQIAHFSCIRAANLALCATVLRRM
jgi:hypothetical protein